MHMFFYARTNKKKTTMEPPLGKQQKSFPEKNTCIKFYIKHWKH